MGGAGYTAGELLRILLNHPLAIIKFVHSNSNAGKPISHIHQDLIGSTELAFTDEILGDIDVVFLCMGHGHSKKFLQENFLDSKVKVIDLSNEFRLKDDAQFLGNTFVYGLPEINREKIAQASHIANPGCFATAIELALMPLAQEQLLNSDIHVHGITGSTGAGQKPGATTHFSWRDSNVSMYKAFTHQHLDEINESLHQTSGRENGRIYFLPMRGNFTRGIFASAYIKCDKDEKWLIDLYHEFYKNHPFTWVSELDIHVKQVVNTNKALLHVHRHDDIVMITSAIDNLLKGASGQAVQNMNLMFGLEETTGLLFKGNLF